MEQADVETEQKLVAELDAMSREILAGLGRHELSEVWQQRREQIAEFRQRIHAMRVRHLGHP